jgi:hypothetical protein
VTEGRAGGSNSRVAGRGPEREVSALAEALAVVGLAVRDAVSNGRDVETDAMVVRSSAGDEIFGVDARADEVLLAELSRTCGQRWPGVLISEGFDEPVAVGDGDGPWRYLADPVDGTRPWLVGKRSAWVLLGAGRYAATLEDLEVGAAVEIPTSRARWGRVAWAAEGGEVQAVDDDLAGGSPEPVKMQPMKGGDLSRTFVTVARFSPGTKALLGRWEDAVLDGLEVYEDPWLCSGGQLMAVASGSDAAVLDPRPLAAARLCAHPYDLAAIVVARAAGVVVEALPPGPLTSPLRPDADVAWAAYANEDVAFILRERMAYTSLW